MTLDPSRAGNSAAHRLAWFIGAERRRGTTPYVYPTTPPDARVNQRPVSSFGALRKIEIGPNNFPGPNITTRIDGDQNLPRANCSVQEGVYPNVVLCRGFPSTNVSAKSKSRTYRGCRATPGRKLKPRSRSAIRSVPVALGPPHAHAWCDTTPMFPFMATPRKRAHQQATRKAEGKVMPSATTFGGRFRTAQDYLREAATLNSASNTAG